MNILQFVTEHSVPLAIGVIVALFFGALQWKFYSNNLRLITNLGEMFLEKEGDQVYTTYYLDDVCMVKTIKGRELLNALIDEINLYVQKSVGTADFNIIQNKTERKTESIYEHATAELSFPTYIGLMGTFTGTFIGLVGFLISGSDLSDEGKVTNLIIGVLVSMLTSLWGLLLTTKANHQATIAKKILDQQKNSFLDFIQLELIPKLQTTVTTLQQTLEGFVPKFDRVISNFEYTFTGIIGRFKDTFDECTKNFGTEFRQNTKLISQTVSTLNDSIENITDNVENQRLLLKELRSEQMFDTLQQFIESAKLYHDTAKEIDNYNNMLRTMMSSAQTVIDLQTEYAQSLHIPQELVERLNSILDRIATFEQSINSLGENIAQSEMLGNQELALIKKHLESFEEKKQLADRFLDTSNDELVDLFHEQGKVVKALFDNCQKQLEDEREGLSSFVRETMQIISKKKNDLYTHLEHAFDVGRVNAMFSHLKYLPEIEGKLDEIEKGIIRDAQLKKHLERLLDFVQQTYTTTNNQLFTQLGNIKVAIDENTNTQIDGTKEGCEALSVLLRKTNELDQSLQMGLSMKLDKLNEQTQERFGELHVSVSKYNENLKDAIIQASTFPQRAHLLMGIIEALKARKV